MKNKVTEVAVTEINRLHNEIDAHCKTVVGKALRIGELLDAKKRQLAHGEWLPWIKENLPFSSRTALNYMRLYENRDRLKLENVSNLTEAYRLLAESPAVQPLTREESERALETILQHREQFTASIASLVEGVTAMRLFRDQKGYLPEFSSFEEYLADGGTTPEQFAMFESIADEVARVGLEQAAANMLAARLQDYGLL